MEEKDFDGWIKVKESVHHYGRVPDIKEGGCGGARLEKMLA